MSFIYLHLSTVVDPELSYDDIVYNCFDFPPSIMVARAWKLQVCDAQGLHLQVLALELALAGELLPTSPTRVGLAVLGDHRRVVQHLLCEAPEPHVLPPVQLVGLAKEGVEGLARSDGGAAVAGDGEAAT